MAKTYTLLENSPSPTMVKGDTVVEFTGHTYGILSDDEDILGVPCMAVSVDGGYPFAVVPVSNLKEND